MNTTYIYIVLGHKSFDTGKIAIIEVPSDYIFISTYRKLAKKKACEKFGLNENETVVLDYKCLGEDVTFIK